jgi:ethanolamine utilization cobalamin adenosyltransferase
VPFVCEQDVRRAMTEQKKIYINKATIVTPAARDLNQDGDVFVRTD